VRHQETIICGGCNSNVRLVDHLGEYRKAERQVRRAVQKLMRELGGMTINIKL
jgi:hypothetical protein